MRFNPRRWVPFWIVPAIVALAIGTVWLRLAIVRTTYEIGQLDRQIHNLEQEHEQAELRLTAMRSPRRLEVLAHTKFGLTQPQAEQVIHVTSAAPIRDNPIKKGSR
jgi:cell division protein FtsL